ncbi:MAG: hypothetical protein LLG04_12345 [Parachlamydia sp.]|nr:hypothetical protein [Parachlamydia sp.]
MTCISWGEVTARIMLDPTSSIKYMGIYSSNPYAKTRYVTLGLAGDNCVGTTLASHAGVPVVNPTLSPEKVKKLSEELKTKFPDSQLSLEELQSDTGLVPTAIKIEGLGHLRALVKHLVDTRMINDSDVEKVVPRVRKVEQHLALEQELVARVTPQQCAIITQEFEKELESMIAVCDMSALNELKNPSITTTRDLALTLLVDCMQRDIGTVLYEQIPFLKDKIQDSAKRLNNFYSGNAGLENKLTEKCFTCPNLEKQREILFKYIEEKLDQAIAPENPSFLDQRTLQKVREHRSQLFVKGETLDMLRNGPYKEVLSSMFKAKGP